MKFIKLFFKQRRNAMGYMMSWNMRGETKYDVLVDWILIYLAFDN